MRPTLDGVENGVWELRRLERLGIRVLNPAASLLTCHDKLQTALRLGRLGVRSATAHVDGNTRYPRIAFPVVVKPRLAAGRADVVLCESAKQLQTLPTSVSVAAPGFVARVCSCKN